MRWAVFHHALGEDDELYVADEGYATESDRGGPERGMVGDAAGDRGEVGVRGGEEVEGYVRGEDLRGKRGGEEGRETGLKDAYCWRDCQ